MPDRNILLNILWVNGMRGKVYEWFKDWLGERRQRTRWNEGVSEEIPCDIGTPQGAPLSCLLFILYINGIFKVPLKCKLRLFADDALLYHEGDDWNEIMRCVVNNLDKVIEWTESMKLKLNFDKTKWMAVCGNKCNLDMSVG